MWSKITNEIKIILFIIILLVVYFIILYFRNKPDIAEENYDNVKKNNTTIELFYSPSCGACSQFKPTWKKLVNTNVCKFVEHNCQNGECTSDITHVPTIKINGKIYDGHNDFNTIISHIQ